MLIIDIGSSIDILMGFTNTRAWIEMIRPDVDVVRNILKNDNNYELSYNKSFSSWDFLPPSSTILFNHNGSDLEKSLLTTSSG